MGIRDLNPWGRDDKPATEADRAANQAYLHSDYSKNQRGAYSRDATRERLVEIDRELS